MNNVNTWIEAVHAYVNEAKEVLDETYRFASSSPKSQRNINDVSALLDDILHAISLAAPTPQVQAVRDAQGEAMKWLFVANGESGDPAQLVWCRDDEAVINAVGSSMFIMGDWRDGHAEEVTGTAEEWLSGLLCGRDERA